MTAGRRVKLEAQSVYHSLQPVVDCQTIVSAYFPGNRLSWEILAPDVDVGADFEQRETSPPLAHSSMVHDFRDGTFLLRTRRRRIPQHHIA